MIKLDMAKAFDRVNWCYLEHILRIFGFLDQFISIVLNSMRFSKLFVSVNGKSYGFFSTTRGVKQGDPLSPLLFIFWSEGFSRGLNHLVLSGVITGFNTGRVNGVSHLAYADDLLILLNGTSSNLRRFQSFLHQYRSASGQLVNYTKSQFVSSSYVPRSNLAAIGNILGMQASSLPIRYLGSFLCRGVNRATYLSVIIAALWCQVFRMAASTSHARGTVSFNKVCTCIPSIASHGSNKVTKKCDMCNTTENGRFLLGAASSSGFMERYCTSRAGRWIRYSQPNTHTTCVWLQNLVEL